MKKLQLNVDELAVEQFQVEAPVQGRGTVLGHNTIAWYTAPCYCPDMPDTATCNC